MGKLSLVMAGALALAGCESLTTSETTVRLEDLDVSTMSCAWKTPQKGRSVSGKALEIGRVPYAHGVGTHAESKYRLKVRGEALEFRAKVGVDTSIREATLGSVVFVVKADGRTVVRTPFLRFGSPAVEIVAPLAGAKVIELIVRDGGDGIANDLADWCDAVFTVRPGTTLEPFVMPPETDQFGILTPPAPETPRINPPRIFGVRPGSPILFTLPVSGLRPMTVSATGLPAGVTLDAATGRLGGSVAEKGEYRVRFTAKNAKGSDTRDFTLVVGDRIALTPPMGWNSWNCFASAVCEKDIKAAADAFVKERLIDYGWSYVNIDDYWQNHQGAEDQSTDIKGPMRHADGTVVVNKRFPDMKGLADYVHAKGLKIGLYSSPGPLTCGRCTGSWGFEEIDARTYADWGYDYLKYDWCSYGGVAVGEPETPLYYQAPYLKMGRALQAQKRDIVFSICQYGMKHVSQWGGAVGGQCWRTTSDITDKWGSLRPIVTMQEGLEHFAKPGNWNDPDMLIVGWVGWGPKLHPTALTPNEQYSHITWWSLLGSPLLIGCDLTKLDAFTKGLLTNPEVLEVNQDPLGKTAARVLGDDDREEWEVWARPLADGSVALGVFNVSPQKREIVVDLAGIGLTGEWKVRDLWRCRDEQPVRSYYRVTLPSHAPHFIRLRPGADGRLAPGVQDVRDAAWNRLFDNQDKRATFEECKTCPKLK